MLPMLKLRFFIYAVIKYLLFKEDSQNFLKLMASSLCLDSITSIEPYIELFAELFYYR